MGRRWTVIVLWLAIALVPLRGLAHGFMAVDAIASTAVVLVVDEASSLPPCHQAVVDESTGTSGGAGCLLCDLCHGTAAVLPEAGLHLALPTALAPPALAAHDTGRPLARGLFRPPRA